MPGTLYIVSTPIGNLEDITLRALRVLREVDLIACEDTRHTRKLLDHFAISKPAVSYHEHNEAARSAQLIERLNNGDSIALVSDAGTPLISDPGFRLLHAAIGAGISVVPVPGPSALLAALAASGLPTAPFLFAGFLPAKSAQRRKLLEQLRGDERTLIFYEAPHRILDALDDLAAVFGNRPIVVARELTKLHEQFLRGTASQIRAIIDPRGEITILIGKGEPAPALTPVPEAVTALEDKGIPRMDAIKQIAKERGLSKREVYRLVTK